MMAGLVASGGRIVWLSASVPCRHLFIGKHIADVAGRLADWARWQSVFAETLLAGRASLKTDVGGQSYVATLERLPRGFVAVEVKLSLPDSVTCREREVLTCIAMGEKPSTIAQRFGLSVNTIDSHRRNLKRKLGLESTAGFTRRALEAGLID